MTRDHIASAGKKVCRLCIEIIALVIGLSVAGAAFWIMFLMFALGGVR